MLLQNERYIVGDKVQALKNHTSNKILHENKVSISTAIARVLEKLDKNNVKVDLVTGLPNEHYLTKNEEALKSLLAGNLEVVLNGNKRSFNIEEDSILVLPENYTVDYEEIPRTLILDLGFRNVNCNILEYGDMVQSFMKHSELGISELKKSIAGEFEKLYNEHFTVEDITDNIVMNGLPHEDDSKEAVKKGIIKYFSSLNNDLESKGIKLKTIDQIVLRGGGTKLVKQEHLQEIYPKFHSKDSIRIEGGEFRNVEVFEEVGRQFFGYDDIEEYEGEINE